MGGRRLCWIQLTPIYFGEPTTPAVITVIQDLTLRHSLTAELHSEREHRQDAEKMAGLGYWEVDVRTGQVVLSAGARRLLGRDVPELSLTSLLSHFDAEHHPRIIAALSQASEQGVAEYESARKEREERLVRAIVAMARDLGKTTIAEGVEDAATLERLCELGVDQAQGYHIGRPAEIGLPVPALPGAARPD